LGIIYVALPFALLTVLAFLQNDTYDPNIVLGFVHAKDDEFLWILSDDDLITSERDRKSVV
jgi:hypothetical protein